MVQDDIKNMTLKKGKILQFKVFTKNKSIML